MVCWWFAVALLGAFDAWLGRNTFNPDGISYFDVADSYYRGNWDQAINAYWSPLYSWLVGLAFWILRPTPAWELKVVTLVDFLIFLAAMSCFHYFLKGLMLYHKKRSTNEGSGRYATFPDWGWVSLGYAQFAWSSICLMGVSADTPDMCVAAIVYLATGHLLRIGLGAHRLRTFVSFGLALGLGYLAKTAMLPLGLVFLCIAAVVVDNLRKRAAPIIAAVVTFLLVVGPFIFLISWAKGHFTIGETARLNCAWHINKVGGYVLWQGGPGQLGTPIHPPRKVDSKVEVYEFASPVPGTYPLWYDPSYWFEGCQPHLEMVGLVKRLARSAARFVLTFVLTTSSIAVIVALTIILWSGGGKRPNYALDKVLSAVLLIPPVVAFGMFSAVVLLPRYVFAFYTVFWMGLLSCVRLEDRGESKRLAAAVSLAVSAILVVSILGAWGQSMVENRASMAELLHDQPPHAWFIADGLKKLGMREGDKVGCIGNGFTHSFWARLGRVRIVAELNVTGHGPSIEIEEVDRVLESMSNPAVIEAFRKTGARAVVASAIPDAAAPSGWQKVGHTDYYALFFDEAQAASRPTTPRADALRRQRRTLSRANRRDRLANPVTTASRPVDALSPVRAADAPGNTAGPPPPPIRTRPRTGYESSRSLAVGDTTRR